MNFPKPLDFEKGGGLMPAVVQDAHTQQVLMLGYMNEKSLKVTQETGKVTFFSRSKSRLWTKGESSGNFLKVVTIQGDCDGDTLLIRAIPDGPTCHRQVYSCFGAGSEHAQGFLHKLGAIITERRQEASDTSYTAELFKKGTHKIAQKVGEEGVELVIEALRDNDEEFKGEASDLLYHFLVLLEDRGMKLTDIEAHLMERHR